MKVVRYYTARFHCLKRRVLLNQKNSPSPQSDHGSDPAANPRIFSRGLAAGALLIAAGAGLLGGAARGAAFGSSTFCFGAGAGLTAA